MKAILVTPNHATRKAEAYSTQLSDELAIACDVRARISEILDYLHDGTYAGIVGAEGTRLHEHVAFFAVPTQPQPGFLMFPQLESVPLAGNVVIVGVTSVQGRLHLTDASISPRAVTAMEHWYCQPYAARQLVQRASDWRAQARPEVAHAQDGRYLLCGGKLRGEPGWSDGVKALHAAREACALAACAQPAAPVPVIAAPPAREHPFRRAFGAPLLTQSRFVRT